ncbi:hypothetical protein L6164_020535 [Bauhinia variegata]|uniref:Uncharacterized protein n=1 Tax=Bauhinia variegata TaxID=167791 RepID=A0ACB9MVQ1_BAUVA|nr:hypothetical protein L6164_020535 [Bauhinia variegata]
MNDWQILYWKKLLCSSLFTSSAPVMKLTLWGCGYYILFHPQETSCFSFALEIFFASSLVQENSISLVSLAYAYTPRGFCYSEVEPFDGEL